MGLRRCYRRDLPQVPEARRNVADAVRAEGWIPNDDVELVTSELVTNAVRYGSGGMEVRVVVGHGVARIEVYDEGGVVIAEPIGTPPLDSLGGRGLYLVRSVSQRWGSGRDADGRTVVWAEVPVQRTVGSPLAGSCEG